MIIAGSAIFSPHPKPHHAHGGGVADHHKKQRMQAMMKVVAGQQQQSHQELLRETRQLPIFFGKAALIPVSYTHLTLPTKA